jgi:hypothetical protein
MKRLALPLLLLLAACGNYGNVYLPQGERKPISGPNPGDFPASLPAPVPIADKAKIRLNAAPGAAELRAAWNCAAPATVVFRVNARKIGEASCGPGECTLARPVPDGTILKGVATLIEIETSAPITLARLGIER